MMKNTSQKQDRGRSASEFELEKKNSFVGEYNALLARYPLIVNGTQAAIIAGSGVIASQFISGATEFNFKEVRIAMLMNLFFSTPIQYFFYRWLATIKFNFYLRLLFDQAVFCPLMTIGVISVRLYLRGTDVNIIPGMVISIFPKTMQTYWMFWVPARGFILYYVPVMFQLLVGSIFSFMWNIILTSLLSSK